MPGLADSAPMTELTAGAPAEARGDTRLMVLLAMAMFVLVVDSRTVL